MRAGATPPLQLHSTGATQRAFVPLTGGPAGTCICFPADAGEMNGLILPMDLGDLNTLISEFAMAVKTHALHYRIPIH
jgi:hypothetical protein